MESLKNFKIILLAIFLTSLIFPPGLIAKEEKIEKLSELYQKKINLKTEINTLTSNYDKKSIREKLDTGLKVKDFQTELTDTENKIRRLSQELNISKETEETLDLINSETETWFANYNPIAIKSDKEKKILLGLDIDKIEKISENSYPQLSMSVGYPQTIDWSNHLGNNYITPVKNQGNCSACWAFSALGAVESKAKIDYNRQIWILIFQNKLCYAAVLLAVIVVPGAIQSWCWIMLKITVSSQNNACLIGQPTIIATNLPAKILAQIGKINFGKFPVIRE
jgi:hypothetical protein